MNAELGAPKWRELIRVWREKTPSPMPQAGADPQRPEDQRVVIVGSGPVGLAQALDLGLRGHEVLLLARFDFVPAGSKAICFSKRSLDILDRLGVGRQAVEKGVVWSVGKVYWQADREPIYQFDMLPVKNQKMPGFINLQQYHMEDLLLDRLAELPNVTIRWAHEVTSVEPQDDGVLVAVSCPDGDYRIAAEWLLACDGSKSAVREMLGLDFDGRVFEDNFLIADIRMKEERAPERWFWFDPPFNPGQSVLMHRQPDDVWRIDFQLGWNIDREACIRPENVDPLIRAMLGEDVEYEEEWYSVYTFQCRRMARFVHGRVVFAGDSAHLVSPFGARGCNGGFADIDNLGWKLDRVLSGKASPALLEAYNYEAIVTADENILNSTRSTDFLTPKSEVSRAFRDAVLDLAGQHAFARPFVNSGRLSTAVSYPDSPLNTPDAESWAGGVAPGSPVLDAPVGDGWLLERLGGRFVLVSNGPVSGVPDEVEALDLAAFANTALACERLALDRGAAVLVRPDHYVAGRWKQPSPQGLAAAFARATGAAL